MELNIDILVHGPGASGHSSKDQTRGNGHLDQRSGNVGNVLSCVLLMCYRGLCYTCSLPLKDYYMDRISSSHTYWCNTQDSRSVKSCGTQAGFYFDSSKATDALFSCQSRPPVWCQMCFPMVSIYQGADLETSETIDHSSTPHLSAVLICRLTTAGYGEIDTKDVGKASGESGDWWTLLIPSDDVVEHS